jgi:glutaredoxin 3
LDGKGGFEMIPMKVIVYSTTTCPWCQMVKEFLKERKIPFEEKDVSMDKAAMQEMLRKSGQMGVPVTDINGKIIVGFDAEAIEKALAGK